ncbi:MAG: site-specific integrase, partial [Isosphaera sp.]|nr:site-specific integrase [Isosphaera sp.]
MPHRPEPWYRASKNAWYVQLDGSQIRLAKGNKDETEKAAWDAFYRLMGSDLKELPPKDKLRTAELCSLFLDYSEKHHAPGTYENYRHFLRSFVKAFGTKLAADLKPIHVTRWLDARPSWKGARRHGILAVKRAYSWAEKQGLLAPNPLKGVEQEAAGRRDRVLTRGEQAEILAAIRDEPFRQFVRAMFETGARPGEVARVTAADVNLDLGVWVFARHKTAKKTKRPRVVYLPPAVVELTRALVAKFPEGPLFRGPRGQRPFTRNNIRCRFKRLREKLPHLKHFVAYTARHTFATRALQNNVGIAQVAELLGHTSTEMVSKVYGHLADQIGHLRAAAAKAAT